MYSYSTVDSGGYLGSFSKREFSYHISIPFHFLCFFILFRLYVYFKCNTWMVSDGLAVNTSIS